MDYLIPTALECPDFELGETVTPCPHHPLGAKGVGESPNVGSPPAIVNAVIDALHEPHGVDHIDMPCTPARVWAAMQGRAGAAAVSDELEHLAPDVETLAQRLAGVDYLVDEGLATALFLSLRLPQPLLLEGEAGVGKTEAAKALAAVLDTPLIRLQCYDGIDAAEALYEWNYPRQLLASGWPRPATSSSARTTCSAREYLIRRPLLRALEHPGPRPAVLLIDEIDRADDDFEAFLLELLAEAAVTIPELGTIRATHPPVDRAHLQPHARPARRGQAPLPVPVDRLPVAGSARSRSCAGACRARRSRWPCRSSTAVGEDARRATCRSRRGSPRRSTGWPRCELLGVADARRGDDRPHARLVLKYGEDQDVVRAAGLESLV